ncbi:Fungal lipase-type domain-containing protein [Caenorhabditis elegans]|uniref:Fungal lipase-type domain-containing protein n=1 Tax=Caenorhabditis elegans TaxID=6239 RepID=Q9XTT1_CAEEL|nr:Fungal lipase-like domain-containing protein [Caenorhabditis elegans]CAB11568.2 Fungal lipase-like domain-containing protein [Caenorhabditis elegans]|eukprot:NP_499630.2 Uncharacterized protein CELE_Y49E10.25 [Caenorhabditis elegans]
MSQKIHLSIFPLLILCISHVIPTTPGLCSRCIQRGEVYCPMFDRCGILPFCIKWINKILNCPDTRNASAVYDDEFTRQKMMPLSAAAYSDNPLPCLKKIFSNSKLIGTYSVECSYSTDSIPQIIISWIAYFLDSIRWVEYNPRPIVFSECFAYIGVDEVEKRIFMGFRGSEGILQLLEQMLTYHRGSRPFYNNGKIYEYFYNAFHLLWVGGLEHGIRRILANRTDDYELWITGLSLGGALASVTSSYIAKLNLFPPSRIKLVTFGQPRVADYDHAAWHDATFPYSFRVINSRDPIPHVPPKIGPIPLFHHGTEIWYPKEMWPLSNYKVCSEADGDYCSNQILLYNIIDHIYYFGIDVGEFGKNECQ